LCRNVTGAHKTIYIFKEAIQPHVSTQKQNFVLTNWPSRSIGSVCLSLRTLSGFQCRPTNV
jgi:hypothetical protein